MKKRKYIKRKKGFTLVELLAVIVVLAIIMVIAIPAIMKSMNKAKKRSFSLYGEKVLNAAENKYMQELNFDGLASGVYNVETDLGLSNTGNYKGYVIVRNCDDKEEYVLVLQDVTYQIMGYVTSDGEYSEDLIEPYDETNFPTVVDNYKNCGIVGNGTEKKLLNTIQSIAKTDNIDFDVKSSVSGTNGVYVIEEKGSNVPVYYYRGKVDNNIIFNNMCWKIIRTTETGGIKLIYNGLPVNNQCTTQTGAGTTIGTSAYNNNYNDNAYAGYMYGTPGSTTYEATHENKNNSTIKTYIDNWFKNNFDDEAISKLEDTVFCNDRSTTTGTNNNTLGSSYGNLGYGKNLTAYGAAARSTVNTKKIEISLECKNKNDKFTVSTKNGNGKLTYPVGLITTDEAILAGFITRMAESNSYLYSNNSYWTMTPDNMGSIGMFIAGVAHTGSLSSGLSKNKDGVRPVIALKAGILIDELGTGTPTNPYVVK